MTDKISVGLIGAGSMGGALLRSWLDEGVLNLARSAVFDPALDEALADELNRLGVAVNPAPSMTVDVLLVAVKPQLVNDVLPVFASMAQDAIVISVMAGKSIHAISAALNGAPRIARVMPNLPASIRKGASGLYATETIDAAGRLMIERLIAASGEAVWVETEKAIDFVTAISGSGPAYYFLMTEALAQAGVALGLSKEIAKKLARATAVGSGALLDADTRCAAELRAAVTSPGGTTAAALDVFDDDEQRLRQIVNEAVMAAAKRAGELMD